MTDTKKPLTQAQVRKRIAGLDAEAKKRTVCALIGHSKIETLCFGYHYCARCGDQVGDTLASVYPGAEKAVVVGHNCKTCRKNFRALTWRDKWMAPDPFKRDRP